jgi:Bacteriophage related domain of unknown function
MSLEAERACIEAHFNSGWLSSPYAVVPIHYENLPLKQPTTDYILHRITDADGRQIEVTGQGPTLHRYIGLVQVDILATAGSGSANSRKMADIVCELYRRKQLTDAVGARLTFRTPSFRAIGLVNERYRFVVTCPFHRDIRH